MLAYYTKRSPGEEFEVINKPLKSGVWVDANNVTLDELDSLVEQYSLARNIVYDVRDRQELPRVEFSGDDVYVFLRSPWLAHSGRVVSSPLLAIVRHDQFFTIGLRDTVSPESVAATTLPRSTNDTADLLLGVIASCTALYQELLRHTERSINDTGNRLRTHEVTNHDFIHFVTVEDNLTAYRMNLDGMLTVVRRLQSTDHIRKINVREALDDIALQIQQLLVAVESYSGRVESIRSAYSTIANNTLNQRMKTLTVLTVLITLPNVFYGMYGMNIALPFAEAPWAYGAVVGFTVALSVIVYFVAKRFRIF